MTTDRKKTILSVEDEPLVQMLLTDFLDEKGYVTLTASEAKSSLVLLESEASIDLLLTDMGLPGMNGRQLAEAARRLRPSLPVIFATGYGGEHGELKDKLSEGMSIIGKPFDMERLAEMIHAMIGRD
jgi:hypothetical protein